MTPQERQIVEDYLVATLAELLPAMNRLGERSETSLALVRKLVRKIVKHTDSLGPDEVLP